MEEKKLKECLECSTKNELIKKMKIAGLRYTGLLKSDLVDTLEEFLLNENNIHKIWKELTPFEREYIEEFLRYDELPSYEKVEYLHEKYGIKKERFKKPWEIESKIKLIFQLEAVPYQIKKILEKYLPPMGINYNALEQVPQDEKNFFNIIGESFSEDFFSIINLVKNEKLSLEIVGKFPSKSAVIKINKVLINKDYVFKYLSEINNISNFQETNRIYGIYSLLAESDLLVENDDIIEVSDKAEEFLELSNSDKCMQLFKCYLKSINIYELNRVVESDYKTEFKGKMEECRKIIAEHLKNCPVGKWVAIEEFLDYIKMINKSFLINQVGSISHYSEKHNMYLEPWCDWKEIEGRFVEVVLQEYLSVMGIVDTIFYEAKGGCSDYDYLPFFKVEYFRITPLGKYVLGVTDKSM